MSGIAQKEKEMRIYRNIVGVKEQIAKVFSIENAIYLWYIFKAMRLNIYVFL